jgi:hypothetical protein
MALWLLLLFSTLYGFGPAHAGKGAGYSIETGGDKAVCREALTKILPFSRHDFLFGTLSNQLGPDRWRTESLEVTDKTGRRLAIDYRYRYFDIDNDGQPEVVVWSRGTRRSNEYDTWDVLSKSDFPAAKKLGFVGDEYSPERISGESVDFTAPDGLAKSLSFMVPWRYGTRNYVIFQSSNFANPEPKRRAPEYIVVTEYQKHPYGDGGRWQPMKVICSIRDLDRAPNP